MIPLSSLPLRESTSFLFQQKGFHSIDQIEDTKAQGGLATLAAELDVPLAEAFALYREIQSCRTTINITSPPLQSAAQLLRDHPSTTTATCNNIITFSRHVDQLLGGGIPLGHLVELSGPPGVGKTQFALQLCVNVTIPTTHGGINGSALYVDTEGSFAPERVYQMAHALVNHLRQSRKQQQRLDPSYTIQRILQGIHVVRVYDLASQRAVLQSLRHEAYQLVVVDSFAFHYRAETTDYMARSRELVQLAAHFRTLPAAVVCINHSTSTSTNTGSTTTTLGESWAHAVTMRLELQPPSTLVLTKSPHRPCGSAQWYIVPEGIRGAEYYQKSHKKRQRTEQEESH